MGLSIGLGACAEQGGQGVPGMDMSVGGLITSRMSQPPPSGAFESAGKQVTGRVRDLDSAVSWSMSREQMAVVEQMDTPADAPALGPGERVYRMVTMQDRPIWLKVSWEGAEAPNDTVARRSDQRLTLWARAGEFGDTSVEDRLIRRVSERLEDLRKRLK